MTFFKLFFSMLF